MQLLKYTVFFYPQVTAFNFFGSCDVIIYFLLSCDLMSDLFRSWNGRVFSCFIYSLLLVIYSLFVLHYSYCPDDCECNYRIIILYSFVSLCDLISNFFNLRDLISNVLWSIMLLTKVANWLISNSTPACVVLNANGYFKWGVNYLVRSLYSFSKTHLVS